MEAFSISRKIGIITLNGYFNYGNRLQNYALEKILTDQGYTPQTVRLDRSTKKQKIREKLSFLKRKITNKNLLKLEKARINKFKSFSKEYINETLDMHHIKSNLTNINSEYDNFIVGSDQVWNPSANSESSAYFLKFADKSKRISYSASFGVSKFDKKVVEDYRNWLKEIPNISVREEEGARIVKKLTNKKVPVLVDPTMLLSKEEWVELAKPGQSKPKNKYLLTYFLGTTPDDYQIQIQAIAKENNLEIVNIGNQEELRYYETGPQEFIDYINDAEIFCTDSFHGVIFSILLEKPFIVYERKGSQSMYSRIRTIIDNFGLESREYKNITAIDNILEIDYSLSQKIIKKQKQRSIDFLRKALDS